jgi:hypothetical protein
MWLNFWLFNAWKVNEERIQFSEDWTTENHEWIDLTYPVLRSLIHVIRLRDFKPKFQNSKYFEFDELWFEEKRFLVLVHADETKCDMPTIQSTVKCVDLTPTEHGKLEILNSVKQTEVTAWYVKRVLRLGRFLHSVRRYKLSGMTWPS